MSRRSAVPAPSIAVEELAHLQAAAAWLTRKAPLPAILTGILAARGRSLGARAQAIRLFEDGSAVPRLSAVWCAPEDGPPADGPTGGRPAENSLADDDEDGADGPGAVSRQVDRWAPLLTPATCIEAARRGELVAWEDLTEPSAGVQPAPPALPPGAQTVWSLPITGQEGRLLGTLATYARRPGRPAPAAVQLARLYAGYAGLAIEQSRLRHRLALVESEYESERGSERRSERGSGRGSDYVLAGDLDRDRQRRRTDEPAVRAEEADAPARALAASEERHRLTTATAIDLILLTDHTDRIIFANGRTRAFLGYPPAAVVGRALEDFVVPEQRPLVRERSARWLAGEDVPSRAEYTLRHRDGTERLTEFSTSSFGRDGRPAYRISVVRDITERARLEAENRRLAAALEAISEAVCLVDLKGRILYVNEADARLFGYTREELIGRSAAIYYADRAHGREIARRTLAGGFRGETTGRRKDDSRVRILLSTALVRDAAGQPTAMVGVAHDLTERLAFEAKLRETEKLTALARLASGVAHNFNNLLAVILGNAELLLEGELLPEQRPRLDAIVAASLNGAQAVKRLQEFTRQRPEMISRPVDLAEVARAAIAVVRPAWRDRPEREGRQIALIEALETAVISGDEGSLREVATNLIINAAEAIAGNGTVQVRTGTRAGEAYLAVTNTGAGLGEDARARLFEPFFTTKDRGTGLGLASSFGIVQQHGGWIDVETRPGSGTTFTVVLPRHAPAPAQAEAPQRASIQK